MESLPLLVLETICEYLALLEPHRSSLLAFACTSKACCAAADRERFSRVLLRADDEEQIRHDLARLEHLLERTNTKRYVRMLKVCPHRISKDQEKEAEDPFSISPKLPIRFYGKPTEQQQNRNSWLEFARFVSGLALKDLIWASLEQLPTCVLSVLHDRNPACRLHMHVFILRSLFQRDGLRNIDDAEYLLATSPCLYSIIGPYSPYGAARSANYNEEAMLEMIAGVAPRLKHVRMWFQVFKVSGELPVLHPSTRLPWRGFYPHSKSKSSAEPKSKGQLESLTVCPSRAVTPSQITAWETRTDLSHLSSLKIERAIRLEAVQSLAHLAECGAFSKLRDLDLPAVSPKHGGDAQIDSALQRLLSSLKPLELLAVTRISNMVFDAAVEAHGARLQTLSIKGCFLDVEKITKIGEYCTNIRELSIEIVRTAGDRAEVQIYRTLGTMQTLEKLRLELHCCSYRLAGGPDDPVPMIEPFGDESTQKEMRVAIHAIFINAAIDENLARSICREILAVNATSRLNLLPKLSSIKLLTMGTWIINGQMMSSDFQDILRWIGRHYVCERDPRDTHLDQTYVEEYEKEQRLEVGEELSGSMEDLSESYQYGVVWNAIWPETKKGWKEDWKSFPLANLEE